MILEVRFLAGFLALGSLLGLAGAPPQVPPPRQEGEPEVEDVVPDEVRDDYARKIQGLVEFKQWGALFQEYRAVLDSDEKRGKVLRLKTAEGRSRWTSVAAYLQSVIAGLPPEALEQYRIKFDNDAHELFNKALGQDDPRSLAAVVERHFFSSVTDEATLRLCTRLVESGRPDEAAYYLERLLRFYPDPDDSIPRALAAARLVEALRLSRNVPQLKKTAAWLAAQPWDQPVTVGREAIRPSAFAARALAEAEAAVASGTAEAAEPDGLEGFVRNEVRLRTYDFKEEPEVPLPAPPRSRTERVSRVVVRGGVPAAAPGPRPSNLFAAYARYGPREVVVATNGAVVAAVDPRSGRTYWVLSTGAAPFGSPDIDERLQMMGGMMTTGNASPFAGASIDGAYAYVTTRSAAAGQPNRQASPWGNVLYPLAARLMCVRLHDAARQRVVGDVVWDTDAHYAQIDLKRAENNWSFCGPPLVLGDRLLVGIVANPESEAESHVACFDRATGRLLWRTFLCQSNGRFGSIQTGAVAWVMPLTLLTHGHGLLFAATNQGAVAALNPVDGAIAWLNVYPKPRARNARGVANPWRVPGRPILHGGALYVLPQDTDRLVCFDAADGAALPAPKPGPDAAGVDWSNCTGLMGILKGKLVLATREGLVAHLATVDLAKGSATRLSGEWAGVGGAGIVDEKYVYVPVRDKGVDQAHVEVFDTGTWKIVGIAGQGYWADAAECGNLMRAGPYVLSMASDRLAIYADPRVVRGWYEARMAAEPPDLDALHEYGMLMARNNVWDEAAGALSRYLKASEGAAAEEPRRTAVRGSLGLAFRKRGDRAADNGRWAEAAEHYERALAFAPDPRAEAEAALKLGHAYRELGRDKDAVNRYHELRGKHPDLPWPADGQQEVQRDILAVATRRIRELVGLKGESVYEDVARQVEQALRELAAEDLPSLERLLERFPESRVLREKLTALLDRALDSEQWREAERVLRRLDQVLEDSRGAGRELKRKFIETLERHGMIERAKEEWRKFKGLFGEDPTGRAAPGPIDGAAAQEARSLARLAAIKDSAREPVPARLGLGPDQEGRRPLAVTGFAPPGLGPGQEFLRAGSIVERWDLAAARPIWTARYPGGWIGASLEPTPEGLKVSDVVSGGPAEAAGIGKGDWITRIEGEAAAPESLAAFVRRRPPGASVALSLKRKSGEAAEVRLTTAPHPAGAWPGVGAAAFAADGSLLVAWHDCVAALALESGAPRWSWPLPTVGTQIEKMVWADGRAYVLSATVPGPARKDVEAAKPNTQAAPVPIERRLTCLDDLSGRLLWERALEQAASVELYARESWDSVVVVGKSGPAPPQSDAASRRAQIILVEEGRAVAVPAPLRNRLLVLDGRTGAVRKAGADDLGAVVDFVVDAPHNRCVWIDRANHLKVLPLPVESFGPAPGALVGRALAAGHGADPSALYRLALWRDRIVLVSTAGPKLWVFRIGAGAIEDGKELKLPDGYEMARELFAGVSPVVTADGMLCVYAVQKGATPNEATEGYVFFFRLDGDDGAASKAPAHAPRLTNMGGGMDVSLRPFLIVTAPQSRRYRESGTANWISLFDLTPPRSGRWIPPEFKGVATSEGRLAAWVQRGRLYFRRGDKLHVYAPSSDPPREEEKEEGAHIIPESVEPSIPVVDDFRPIKVCGNDCIDWNDVLSGSLLRGIPASDP
jgi:tetratricopeptide (TPR) repeat protein/outer membrane protein assembly factor BamB